MSAPQPLKKRTFRDRLRGAGGRFKSGSIRVGRASKRGARRAGHGAREGVHRARSSESARSFGIAGRALGRYGSLKVRHEPARKVERRAKRILGKKFLRILQEETTKAQRKKILAKMTR